MKEYGLSDEELKALGEKTVASGKNLLLGGKSEPKQDPQEMWDGDFDFLMDFWFQKKGRTMTDLGKKIMESMFDAWCDDECKEFTPDHNDYSHSLPEIVDYISELTGASREQKYRIEHELEDLVNRTEKNTFTDGFYIAMAVATGKLF